MIRLDELSAGVSSRLLTNNYLRASNEENGAPDRIDSVATLPHPFGAHFVRANRYVVDISRINGFLL